MSEHHFWLADAQFARLPRPAPRLGGVFFVAQALNDGSAARRQLFAQAAHFAGNSQALFARHPITTVIRMGLFVNYTLYIKCLSILCRIGTAVAV